MYFLKLSGALLVLCASTMTGFYYSARLKQRADFFASFLTLIKTLKTEIRFSSRDIFSLLSYAAPKEIGEIINAERSDFESYWNAVLTNIRARYSLGEDEVRLLEGFSKGLGATDVEGQEAHLEHYAVLFENACNNSLLEYKSKNKLCKILGFFSGAILAILII